MERTKKRYIGMAYRIDMRKIKCPIMFREQKDQLKIFFSILEKISYQEAFQAVSLIKGAPKYLVRKELHLNPRIHEILNCTEMGILIKKVSYFK